MQIAPRLPSTTVAEITVVLVGSFTPTIFQPAWFAVEDLLRKVEAEEVNNLVVHDEITQFSTEWLSLEVTRERFIAKVKSDAYLQHLSDFVRGVIATLIHTPIQQLGTNVELRVRFASSDDWHAFGHLLTPKTPWQVPDLKSPGLRNLNMQYERMEGTEAGCTVIGVHPVLNTRTDVLFRVNDHYDSGGSRTPAEPNGH
ncbi:hypothetical protein WJ972_00505 [Achromobacter insuavis]